MTKKQWDSFIQPFRLVYEGEGEGGESGESGEGEGGEGEGGEGEGSTATLTKPKTDQSKNGEQKPKTFTQDEVNNLLKTEKQKNNQNRDKLIKDLEKLRSTATLTEAEKESLTSKIEQLQNETLTAQELAKKDKDALLKTHGKELAKSQQETNFWRDLYSREKIDREIIDAAIENDAASPQQIVKLVRGDTKLMEVLDGEGKGTKVYVSKVAFQVINDDDQSVKILDLNVKEAIKRMKDMPEHANLFKTSATGGVGAYNTAGGATFKGKTPPTDPNEYRKWRKENPQLLGTKR